MTLLGIAMFCKLKLNLLSLRQFGGAHSEDYRLQKRRMIEYGVLSPLKYENIKGLYKHLCKL